MRKIYKNFVRSTLGLLALGLSFSSYGQVTSYPFTEGFEGGAIPAGWTQEYVSGTIDWAEVSANGTGNVTPRTGSGMAEFRESSYGPTTKLVTPQLDLSSLTTPMLKFYFANENWLGDVDELRVYYKSSAGGSWTQIGPDYTAEHATWEEVEFVLPSPSSDYYIAFEGTSNWARGLNIDDVEIAEAPSCVSPSSLAISNLTSTSAELGWTENGTATTWNIEYGTAGFTPTGTPTNAGVTSNPFNLTGLTPETDYEFYVQADCGGGDLSSWTGPFSFYTGYCEVSTTYSEYLTSITSTGAVSEISYTASSQPAGSYADETAQLFESFESQTFDIETDYSSGSNGVNVWVDWNNNLTFDSGELMAYEAGSNSTKTLSITIPVGTPVGDYRMRVRGQWGPSANPPACGNVSYGSTVDFTLTVVAPPSCLPPSALNTSNITATSVDLDWTENGTATTWNIEYGTAGFTPTGTPTNAGVTSNPFNLTGLTQNTEYEFYVQADCGSGDLSTWAGPFSFTSACASTTIPFTQDFEAVTTPALPNCGSIENTGIGTNWRTSSSATGFTGKVLNYSYHSASNPGNANSWYYTQGIQMFAGVSYDISYIYGNNTTSYTESMKVAYGTSAAESAMTTQIADYPIIELSTPLSELVTFTVPADGVYYFGFNAYSIEDQNQLYVDDISVVETPACPAPSALTTTNVTAASADLGWTENGTATTWNIEYDTVGFTLGTGTPENGVTSNPFTLTGLNANTDYEFYVQADCGGTDTSAWVGPFSFTTPCDPYSIPYAEGFENGYTHNDAVAGCISQESNSGSDHWTANETFTTYNRTPRTGNWNAFLRYSNEDWMFIPVQLTGGTSYTAELYARQDGTSGADIEVAYGTSGTDASMTDIIVPSTAVVDGNYQLISGTFTPSNTGVYFVGIKGTTTFSPWYISVDDIAIYETPTCPDPSALIASNFTATSVDLSWTENGTATAWNIEYGPAGFTQGTGTVLANIANPYTVSALMPCTPYEYYVQADCGVNTSAMVGPFAFTTQDTPATGTDTQVACETFTWIDGNTYTSSNNTATFTIVGGGSSLCGNDSIVTLDLTINNATMGTDVQAACETFDWIDGNTYTASNNTATFTIVGGNANGCDSIVTLDLTIDTPPNAGDDVTRTFCMNQPLDLDTLLSANADAGGSWVDPSGNAITGTVITLSGTPDVYIYTYVTAANGACPAATASIEITVDGGCDYLSVDTEALVDISVYPNPTANVLTILNPSNTSSLKVEMLDMNGRVVLVENKALNNATEATLAIEYLETGIYTLRVYNNEGSKTFKIVKQ